MKIVLQILFHLGKAGLIFNFNHVNYKTFFKFGCDCSVCGLKGKFFIIGQFVDRRPNREKKATHHFFLFGVDEDGNEIEISHQRGTSHVHPPVCAKCIDSMEEFIR